MAKQEQGQEQEQSKKQSSEQDESASSPGLPKAMQKRISMKWLTIEALSKVIARLENHDQDLKVVLLTAAGRIEGRLNELKLSYAESFTPVHDRLLPDVSSMVTHVRSELLRTYEQEEQELEIIDGAPILSLSDVVLITGQGLRSVLPQLTVYADQVIGFSIAPIPEIQ